MSPTGRKSKRSRKSFATILVHWFSALLVILMFASAWSKQLLDDEIVIGKQLITLHKQMGILILFLLLVRLLARKANQKNTAQNDLPPLLFWAGQSSHLLLYSALFVLPLLGWAMSNASGHVVTFLGLIPLPNIVAINAEMAEKLHDWHEIISWALGGLIILHISAALWHHFIRKDHVLTSMVPWLQKKHPDSRQL
jgi:superoxide oxidase